MKLSTRTRPTSSLAVVIAAAALVLLPACSSDEEFSTPEYPVATFEVAGELPSDVEANLITSDRYWPWLTTVVDITG